MRWLLRGRVLVVNVDERHAESQWYVQHSNGIESCVAAAVTFITTVPSVAHTTTLVVGRALMSNISDYLRHTALPHLRRGLP